MKAWLISLASLAALASGCTFGKCSLPDGFEVRAVGGYLWSPIPFAEGGDYYEFIGLGWLVHHESEDEVHLSHLGRELAVAGSRGRAGWKLSAAGRKLVAERGWALGEFDARELAGTVQRVPRPVDPPHAPRKHFAPGTPLLNDEHEGDYIYWRAVAEEPVRTLDEKWDTVVFLVSLRWGYVRIVGYDATHYEPLGCSFSESGLLIFSLRERDTGNVLTGRYSYPAGVLEMNAEAPRE